MEEAKAVGALEDVKDIKRSKATKNKGNEKNSSLLTDSLYPGLAEVTSDPKKA